MGAQTALQASSPTTPTPVAVAVTGNVGEKQPETATAPEASKTDATKDDDNQTRRLSMMISRKERELSKRSDELNAKEKSLKDIEAKAAANKKYLEAIEKAKDDPFALIDATGLPRKDFYSKLTRHILNDGVKPDADVVVERLSASDQRLAEIQKRLDDRERADAERADAAGKATYLNFVKSKAERESDKYEMINAYGDEAIGEIYALIEGHHEQTGKILTEDEAMGMIESHYRSEAAKIAKTKWLREMLAAESKEKAEADKATKQGTQKTTATGSPTLSNNTAASPAPKERVAMSEADEWRAFIRSKTGAA